MLFTVSNFTKGNSGTGVFRLIFHKILITEHLPVTEPTSGFIRFIRLINSFKSIFSKFQEGSRKGHSVQYCLLAPHDK